MRVPLGRGNKLAAGYCVRVDREAPEGLDPMRIKELVEVLDPLPLIDRKMLELTRWLAEYYACSWGQALDAAVPAGVKKHAGTRVGTFLVVPEETREALTRRADRAEALGEAGGGAGDPLPRRRAAHDVRRLPAGQVRLRAGPGALRSKGWCTPSAAGCRWVIGGPSAAPAATRPDEPADGAAARSTAGGGDPRHGGEARSPRLILTDEQAATLARIEPALESGGFAPFLIHGVTGSGKTEVYLSAIERVVARGREAIVLVPEISLTPQTIRRFRRRFARVAVLHSHLSDAERHRHWQSIAAGEVEVVVGVRSAVFAPARRLGLIVIDEEHESTFKQETTPRYHARDVAVKRAQMEGIPILLGSATPSLETWRNAERGRYTRLAMPSRVGGRPMPEVEIIDLRHEKAPLGGLSESLRQAMTRALDEGGQVILLLNRRGFHTFVICPKCGQVVKCHACDVAATYHKSRHILDLPHLRRRACLPAGLPVVPRHGAALRRDRHRAARAARSSWRSPSTRRGGWTPTRCGRPAATSRCWRRSRPARCGSCWARR